MVKKVTLANARIPFRSMARTFLMSANTFKLRVGDSPEYHYRIKIMLDFLGEIGANHLARVIEGDEMIAILNEELTKWTAETAERESDAARLIDVLGDGDDRGRDDDDPI